MPSCITLPCTLGAGAVKRQRGAPDSPRIGQTVPASDATSLALSKALKARGFKFVGAVTVYAFMQAVGMVNDHAGACPRREACANT